MGRLLVPSSKQAPSSSRRASRAATPAASKRPGAAVDVPSTNLQRIVKSVDPLGAAGARLENVLTPLRAAAVSKIFTGFDQVHRSLFNIGTILKQPPLPQKWRTVSPCLVKTLSIGSSQSSPGL